MKRLKDIYRIPHYLAEGILYHLAGTLYTPRPRILQFPVTDRCNARCIMCQRWKVKPEREIDLKKIQEIFSSHVFKRLEEANLHGGEPTLRRDLAVIFKIIQDSCPSLRRMWLSTNGLVPELVERRAKEILSTINLGRLSSFVFNVSLDGIGETHDKIRGVPGAFQRALKTIGMLKDIQKEYSIGVAMNTVIQPLNLKDLGALEDLAQRLDVSITFQPLIFATFFDNNPGDPSLQFGRDHLRLYREFIERKFLYNDSATALYWHNFLAMLDGSKRSIPCIFDRYVLSLYPTGEILPCHKEDWMVFGNVQEKSVEEIWFSNKSKGIRERMRKEICPRCNFYCLAEDSLKKEFFTYLGFFIKRKLNSFVS